MIKSVNFAMSIYVAYVAIGALRVNKYYKKDRNTTSDSCAHRCISQQINNSYNDG